MAMQQQRQCQALRSVAAVVKEREPVKFVSHFFYTVVTTSAGRLWTK